MQVIQSIQNRIYEIRGERVMLAFDLANLFEVKTTATKEGVLMLNEIYEAIENPIDEKALLIKWGKRQRIGFKKQG